MGIRNIKQATTWLLTIILILLSLLACSQKGVNTPFPTITAETETTPSPKDFYQFTLDKTFGNGIVEAADWAPDGSTFALATSLRVDIYDAQTLEIVSTLNTGQWNQEIEYSPDGKFLAVGGKVKIIQLWELQTKKLVHSLVSTGPEPYYGDYLSFSFSEDGKRLVSAHYQTVYLWDVSSGDMLESFPGHIDGIGSVALSPNGETIVAAGTRGIFIRDVSSRELL